jgi:hypothetical protein
VERESENRPAIEPAQSNSYRYGHRKSIEGQGESESDYISDVQMNPSVLPYQAVQQSLRLKRVTVDGNPFLPVFELRDNIEMSRGEGTFFSFVS